MKKVLKFKNFIMVGSQKLTVNMDRNEILWKCYGSMIHLRGLTIGGIVLANYFCDLLPLVKFSCANSLLYIEDNYYYDDDLNAD